MPEDRGALIAHFREMRQELLAEIDGLSEPELTDPSVDGWSVKDHLAHLAFWDDIRAAEVERISAGHESAWRIDAGQDEVLNEVVTAARKGLSLAQARWEFDRAHERLIRALEGAPDAALDPVRYGEAPLNSTHVRQHAGWLRDWKARRGR